MVPTFQEIIGYSLYDYVILSLPGQRDITDSRREKAVEVAVTRYTKLVKDGLPMGCKMEGETIIENENDPCPIGYPSKGGKLDLAKIIDELDFKPVVTAYRKI